MPSNVGFTSARPFLGSAIFIHHHIRLRRRFQSLCSLASISLPFDDPLSEKEVRGIIHVTSTYLCFSHPLRYLIQCFILSSFGDPPSPQSWQTSRVNGPEIMRLRSSTERNLHFHLQIDFPPFVPSFVRSPSSSSLRVSDGTWLPLSPLAAPPTPSRGCIASRAKPSIPPSMQ